MNLKEVMATERPSKKQAKEAESKVKGEILETVVAMMHDYSGVSDLKGQADIVRACIG